MRQTRKRNCTELYDGEVCKACQTTTRQVRDNRCVYCLKKRQDTYNIKLREANFMSKHGVSYAERQQMYDKQNGCCAICGEEGSIEFLPKGSPMTGRLVVDHCHDSSKIRGLLCNSCNLGLGMFKNDTDKLIKAIDYLVERG